MKIHNVAIKNFTAFKDFSVECGEGLNVIIGGNGTGKTLFLKVCRVLLGNQRDKSDEARSEMSLKPLLSEFMPSAAPNTSEQIFHNFETEDDIELSLNDRQSVISHSHGGATQFWPLKDSANYVYIPPKDITENAPGFRSLYSERYIAYDRSYFDLLTALCLPQLKENRLSSIFFPLLKKLEEMMGGTPVIKWNDQFFLKTPFGELDYALVAEGIRKISLLWLLIKTGSIRRNTILLWDEPEANLNPVFKKELMSILFFLVKSGAQIFLSTHDNFILNETELRLSETQNDTSVRYLAFYRNGNGEIKAETAKSIDAVNHNCIAQAFGEQYDRKYQVVEDAW